MSSAPGRALLVHNASELATLAGGLRRGAAQGDVAALTGDVAVAAYEGRIVAVGETGAVEHELRALGITGGAVERLDARRGTVTPGLIDPHTHLLFGGTRQAEVELRQRGLGYLDILAAGGGILQTVRETRSAPDEELLAHGRRWLGEMLSHGVTTIEAKSGYGLDASSELRLLALTRLLADEGPVEIVATFLGAHAVAPEYRGRPDATEAYVANVIEEQLPQVVAQGVATSCDVFCEPGVFDADASRRLLEAARRQGLALRLHADELADAGGATLAAELGALSADHLGAVSPAGIAALARAAEAGRPIVATLLPLTSFYLGEAHYAPARQLIEAGVPVAVGTDFNPGTSPSPNAQLALALAVHRLQLSPAQALAATTINAAGALGLEQSHGSLEVGKHADLVVWRVSSHTLLPYWLGADLAQVVVKRGRVAWRAQRAA